MTVLFIDPDVEGNVLVHGIAELRVVADGVLGGHAQPAALLVQVAGLLAEAVEVILLPVHAGEVAQAAHLILFKGPLGQVPVDAGSLAVKQREGQGALLHDQLNGGRAEGQGLFAFLAGHIQGGDPLAFPLKEGVQPVGPGGGHQGIGLLGENPVKADTDADHVVRQEYQHHIGGIAVDQVSVFGFFEGLVLIQKHGLCSPYMPIRSKFSKETVRVTSFRGLGYLTRTAFLVWL